MVRTKISNWARSYYSKETKLPDPDIPLNEDDRVPIAEQDIKRHTERRWKFDSSKKRCWSAGLDADIPIFLPAGGGLGYNKNIAENLIIECEQLTTARFVPKPSYLTNAPKNDFVPDYCRKGWFPSVYMVTGLKIAEKASIQSENSSTHGGGLKANVDATVELEGVAIKVHI